MSLRCRRSLVFDLKLEKLQLFGEIMDSRGELNDEQFGRRHVPRQHARADPGVRRVDAADACRRAARAPCASAALTLDIGKRRLISRNRFRNTVSTFTGVDWQWQGAAGQNARAFYLIPMRILPATFDELARQRVRARSRAARQRRSGAASTSFQDDSTATRSRSTASTPTPGAPLRTAPATWTSGRSAHASSARPRKAAGTTRSRPWPRRGTSGGSVAGTPRTRPRSSRSPAPRRGRLSVRHWRGPPNLMFQYDDASGDEDPFDGSNERFNTLFGDRRFEFTTTGIYGPFNRSNLRRARAAAHVPRRTRACKECCTTARFGSPPRATRGSASARATRPGAPETRSAGSSKGRSRGPPSRTGSRSRRASSTSGSAASRTQTGVAVSGDPDLFLLRGDDAILTRRRGNTRAAAEA